MPPKKRSPKTVPVPFWQRNRVIIDISTQSIIKVVIAAFALWFVFTIREILIALFVAFILTTAINPVVDRLQKYKVPRAVSALGIFVIIFGLLALLVRLIIPPIANQLVEIAQQLPSLYEIATTRIIDLRDTLPESVQANIQNFLQSLASSLQAGAVSGAGAISGFFGGFFSLITIFVLTFYMTVQENSIKKMVKGVFPKRHHAYMATVVARVEEKLGAWVRGQLMLSLIIGFAVFVGLAAIGVEYALVLAILAGIMELFPIIGVIIAIIPALFLAFTQSPPLALGVLILYTIIQQLENNLIVPKVMQKAVGLNPMVILVAILIGAKLAGIMGVLLAVPVVTTISIFFKDFIQSDEKT
jgi:predicted PurR-regulated permease PerM